MNRNEKHLQEMRSLIDIQCQLQDQQAEYLETKAQKYEDTIKDIISYGYKFTHPRIKWKSSIGPIMTLQNNHLYVYKGNQSVVKFSVSNKSAELSSSLKEVVKAGGFEDALVGFSSIDSLLQDYVDALHLSIHLLEQQLKQNKE
jgi:hypothetical protein